MRSSLVLATFALTGAMASAQVCVLTPFPSGQPALPFAPICIGAVPPPMVWAVGNPGFALSALAPPPVPIGSPMVLLFGMAPFGPFPVFAPLSPAFALPGLLAAAPPFVTAPAGLSGPAPGPPVPVPLGPTGGPVGTVGVHTVVLTPIGIAMTAATWITI